MGLHLRHIICGLAAGFSLAWSQAGAAAVDNAGNSLSTAIKSGSAQLVELLPLNWAWLIGAVLIALVVVRRNRKAP